MICKELSVSPQVEALCRENRCGFWDAHPMCPPRLEASSYIRHLTSAMTRTFLLQWSQPVSETRDNDTIISGKNKFHSRLLWIEQSMRTCTELPCRVLVAGACQLCGDCPALPHSVCIHPRHSRPSLESLGIDVQALLQRHDLDHAFRKDRILWTGALMVGSPAETS